MTFSSQMGSDTHWMNVGANDYSIHIHNQSRIRSVAFCCISTGEFHFPNEEAAKIAVKTVTEFMKEYSLDFDRIIFNVFKDEDKYFYEKELKKER